MKLNFSELIFTCFDTLNAIDCYIDKNTYLRFDHVTSAYENKQVLPSCVSY